MTKYYAQGLGEISKEKFDKIAAENKSKPWDGTFDGIYRDQIKILAYNNNEEDSPK